MRLRNLKIRKGHKVRVSKSKILHRSSHAIGGAIARIGARSGCCDRGGSFLVAGGLPNNLDQLRSDLKNLSIGSGSKSIKKKYISF